MILSIISMKRDYLSKCTPIENLDDATSVISADKSLTSFPSD